jgi:hypothetical protein
MRSISEPAPGTRTVWATTKSDPSFLFFKGDGQYDLKCGKCARRLAAGLGDFGQLQTVVIKCPKCGTFNDTDATPNVH